MHARLVLTISLSLLTGISGCTTSPSPEGGSNPLTRGKEVFNENCATCHGENGDGQGTAAYLLFPKPRNFLRSEFKLRSTPDGVMPTDEDLLTTISQGMPGTAMFAFAEVLSEEDRRAVVDYVKDLTPGYENAQPITEDVLLNVPAAPEPTPELLELGRLTYEKLGCAQCHGPEGRGDGPAAPTLVDTSGDPFPAADFGHGIYKSGGRPENLYRTFLTGMSGTPMPSYQQALQTEQILAELGATTEELAYALVYFNFGFAANDRPAPIAGDPGPLEVVAVDDPTVLTDPDSEAWDGLEPHRVYLRPLWYRNDYPLFVRVWAARVDGRIAILAEWDDPSEDATVDREQTFSDGFAVQFGLTERLPFIAMGDQETEGLVELWHWRADRQLALDIGSPAKRSDAYPNMIKDIYPFPDFSTTGDTGNVLAEAPGPAHTLNAEGHGTLTARPLTSQRIDGNGRWRDGTYRVLLSTNIQPADSSREVDFTEPTVPVAFAIWDGNSGDRDGTKLVSQWLMLSPGTAPVAVSQRRPQ